MSGEGKSPNPEAQAAGEEIRRRRRRLWRKTEGVAAEEARRREEGLPWPRGREEAERAAAAAGARRRRWIGESGESGCYLGDVGDVGRSREFAM